MRLAPVFISLMLIIVLAPATIHAQSYTVTNDSSKRSIDISGQYNGAEIQLPAVKKQPEFPGGKKAWHDFLRANINVAVPFANKANPGTYKVMIRFIVGNDGKLSGIGAETNFGYGMETEVIRCIKKSNEWIPAETSSGKKVRFTLRTIVIFNVKQNDITISF